MDESKFQELLLRRGVAIVHFSHFAVMGYSVEFPHDLQHAIDFYQSETRSCCALSPMHGMELPGSVGVIFRPTFQQVLSVLSYDSGSSNFGGSENSGGRPPSEEAILASFNVPVGRYNEWRVKGAEPIGIFVADANNVCVKKKTQYSIHSENFESIACTNIIISSVLDAFPTLPIHTMGPDGLCDVRNNCV